MKTQSKNSFLDNYNVNYFQNTNTLSSKPSNSNGKNICIISSINNDISNQGKKRRNSNNYIKTNKSKKKVRFQKGRKVTSSNNDMIMPKYAKHEQDQIKKNANMKSINDQQDNLMNSLNDISVNISHSTNMISHQLESINQLKQYNSTIMEMTKALVNKINILNNNNENNTNDNCQDIDQEFELNTDIYEIEDINKKKVEKSKSYNTFTDNDHKNENSHDHDVNNDNKEDNFKTNYTNDNNIF